jgi:prepilin-type N-terminal cleavage/methylation domain-containing protein
VKFPDGSTKLKEAKMKDRALTLVELIVVLIIISILATVGIPFFQNMMESSKQKVCDTNLLAAKKAVELYTMEHDTVPGALSQVDDKYLDKAFASVMSGKDAWKIKLAHFLVEGSQQGLAYANTYGLPKLRCPANPNPSSVSYGLNSKVAGISSIAYKDLDNDTVIVADAASELFSYTGAGGVSTSLPDTSFTPSPLNSMSETRAHKTFMPLNPAKMYFRGVTKNETKGAFYYSGASFIKDDY